jgi:hypothetical protein
MPINLIAQGHAYGPGDNPVQGYIWPSHANYNMPHAVDVEAAGAVAPEEGDEEELLNQAAIQELILQDCQATDEEISDFCLVGLYLTELGVD